MLRLTLIRGRKTRMDVWTYPPEMGLGRRRAAETRLGMPGGSGLASGRGPWDSAVLAPLIPIGRFWVLTWPEIKRKYIRLTLCQCYLGAHLLSLFGGGIGRAFGFEPVSGLPIALTSVPSRRVSLFCLEPAALGNTLILPGFAPKISAKSISASHP